MPVRKADVCIEVMSAAQTIRKSATFSVRNSAQIVEMLKTDDRQSIQDWLTMWELSRILVVKVADFTYNLLSL